jgi:Gpi18-like mannosyltransferase
MKKNILIVTGTVFLWVVSLNVALHFSTLIPARTGYIHPYFAWANFDGIHYLEISRNGYTNNMRFMPLYPLLIKIISYAIPFIQLPLLASIISLVCFFFSIIYLAKLLKLEHYPHILKTALVLLTLPTSFFFLCVYSESLFLFLTIAAIYYARKKSWYMAAICGFLASTTRIVGFLIVVPLLIEFMIQTKERNFRHLCALLVIPIGTALYALYNFVRWGNPLLFIQAHSQLSNGRSSTSPIFFPQTLYRYFKILTSISFSLWEWKIALLEVTTFVLTALVIYMLWRQKARLSYLVYMIVSLAVPASTGTFTGLPRYIVVLFPLIFAVSRIKNRAVFISILVASFSLQLLLFIFFSRGYYVA